MARGKRLRLPSSSEEEEEDQLTNPIASNPNHDAGGEGADDVSESESGSESESEEAVGEPAQQQKKKKLNPTTKPTSDSGSESESDEEQDPAPEKEKKSVPEKKWVGKSPLFQRIWSLEDETAVLKGIVKYRKKTGILPLTGRNLDGFHKFIAPSLSISAANMQLGDKIRHLKRKYKNVAARAKSGKDLLFSTPHDRAIYELSKKIWADNDGQGIVSSKINGAAVGAMDGQMTVSDGVVGRSWGDYPYLSQEVREEDNAMSLSAFEMMSAAQARMLEDRFKKQAVAEMKNHQCKMLAFNEYFELVMRGMGKSK